MSAIRHTPSFVQFYTLSLFNKNLVRFVVCWKFVVDSLIIFSLFCDVSSSVWCVINSLSLVGESLSSFEFLIASMLWPRKGSLMKTQTQILDNWLYYTRKIELHRKGKKSRTVRISPIVICSSGSQIHVLITVRRVHYSKMGKVPTTHLRNNEETSLIWRKSYIFGGINDIFFKILWLSVTKQKACCAKLIFFF